MFASSFWGSDFWGSDFWAGSGTVPRTGERDRSVLRAMATLLRATRAFSLVTTSGPPEFAGQSAEHSRMAGLELVGFDETSPYSDHDACYLVRTVQYLLHIHVRDQNPDRRDDECDRLYGVASNAISGVGYSAGVVPNMSWVRRGQYLPADGIERRLRCLGQFVYTVPDWPDHNTQDLSDIEE